MFFSIKTFEQFHSYEVFGCTKLPVKHETNSIKNNNVSSIAVQYSQVPEIPLEKKLWMPRFACRMLGDKWARYDKLPLLPNLLENVRRNLLLPAHLPTSAWAQAASSRQARAAKASSRRCNSWALAPTPSQLPPLRPLLPRNSWLEEELLGNFCSDPVPQKVTFIENVLAHSSKYTVIDRLAANQTFVQSEQKIPHRSQI